MAVVFDRTADQPARLCRRHCDVGDQARPRRERLGPYDRRARRDAGPAGFSVFCGADFLSPCSLLVDLRNTTSSSTRINCGSWLACDGGGPATHLLTETPPSQAIQLPQWFGWCFEVFSLAGAPMARRLGFSRSGSQSCCGCPAPPAASTGCR